MYLLCICLYLANKVLLLLLPVLNYRNTFTAQLGIGQVL